jgi:beta-phosphoglucomutase-like phosphatase (HAD superfamily)
MKKGSRTAIFDLDGVLIDSEPLQCRRLFNIFLIFVLL